MLKVLPLSVRQKRRWVLFSPGPLVSSRPAARPIPPVAAPIVVVASAAAQSAAILSGALNFPFLVAHQWALVHSLGRASSGIIQSITQRAHRQRWGRRVCAARLQDQLLRAGSEHVGGPNVASASSMWQLQLLPLHTISVDHSTERKIMDRGLVADASPLISAHRSAMGPARHMQPLHA